jgi:hypothetical protein
MTKSYDRGHYAIISATHACRSFAVVVNAVDFQVGFQLESARMWTYGSPDPCIMRGYEREDNGLYHCRVAGEAFNSLPCARNDIFIISCVGNSIEVERNGRKLTDDFEKFHKKAPGFEVTGCNLVPVIWLHEVGDSVTMLDYTC